jgi:IclR family transcriptional regulator, acetate operon repressor
LIVPLTGGWRSGTVRFQNADWVFHIMKPAAYPGTQAVQRALSLLKACGQGGAGRRLVDLARAVDLNKTTAFRLLTALESAGLVERTADGEAYQIGAELTRLAGQALGNRALLAAGRPALLALAAATRETVTLEVLVDDEVLIVDEVVGSHVIAAMPSLGTRWPAHATSTGKVLLAGLSDLELQRRTRARLTAYTPRTVVSPAAFRREVLRVRERGYATSVEELEPGFVAVGAPVRAAGGTVIGAVSVGGPRSRFSPAVVARIARELPAAANGISERLGWRPTAPARSASARPAPRPAP